VLLTGSALVQQQRIQSGQIAGFRHGHQEVSPVPSQLTFHAALGEDRQMHRMRAVRLNSFG